MSEDFSIYTIPSDKFETFFVCPLRKKYLADSEPVEFVLLPEIEDLLSPSDSRRVIAKILATSIIKHAREVIKTHQFYVHAYHKKNFVFYEVGKVNGEAEAYKLVKDIDARPAMFQSNELFTEKIRDIQFK